MNQIERKLYKLVNILSEAEGQIVKGKKSGNVYMVKSFDPAKHDKPTPDEIEATKQKHGGKIPKGEKSTQKPEKEKPAGAAGDANKPQPVKIAAADFKTDAEKTASAEKAKTTKSQSTVKPAKLSKLIPPSKKPPLGEPQGEHKPNPELKPPVDAKGKVPGTEIPVKNEEKPDPEFTKKLSTKMDKFAERVIKEEGRAQLQVIDEMKKEGKLPQDFKAVNPRDMGFGFQHPDLKDNPALQKEMSKRIKEANKPPHFNMCKVSIPGTNKFCDENIGLAREEMPQLGGKPKPGSKGEEKAKKIADQNVRKKMEIGDGQPIPPDRQKEYDDLYSKEKTDHVNVEKDFEDYLEKEGIEVSEPMEVPTSSLKATQNELVGEQVVGMITSLEEDPNNPFITAPIMVTRDGYVIDGHHRWATIHMYNSKHTPPNGDKPAIPMKVRVVDEDIDTHIPRANKFANEMGIETMSGKAKTGDKKSDKKSKSVAENNIIKFSSFFK